MSQIIYLLLSFSFVFSDNQENRLKAQMKLIYCAWLFSIIIKLDDTKGLGYPSKPVNPDQTKNECEKRIFNKCNHDTKFTDKELETVRQYLNYTFTQLADIKPNKPLCDDILVRQDWKCLTKSQKYRVANTWKQLYTHGNIKYLAELHRTWWSS